jgi:hypothetical protein
MTKYTISKGQQNEDVLNINGVQSICPYVQALPVTGQYGQIQIMRLPCNAQCPHAKISNGHYHITCGGSLLQFKLEESDVEVKPTSNTLILV